MRIDIWSDIACPWCFIGLTRFERVLAEFDQADEVDVRLHAFQLDPGLPESFSGTEAEYLARSKGIDPASVDGMFAHVRAAAATEGLTLDFDRVKVANSRRAHRLLQAAGLTDATGRQARRLGLALFKAHFTQGESIWEPEILVAAATSVGMDATTALTALDSPDLDRAVMADLQLAADYGIRGVPNFILDGRYQISGAQPEETFASALRRAWQVHARD